MWQTVVDRVLTTDMVAKPTDFQIVGIGTNQVRLPSRSSRRHPEPAVLLSDGAPLVMRPTCNI